MNNKWKYIAKAVSIPLAVNFSMAMIMLLYANNIVSDVVSLLLTLGILITSCGLFSVIKGKRENYLIYNIVSLLSHLVFILVTLLILGFIYDGWETAMFFWTEILSLFAYFVSVLLDSIVCFVNTKINK